MNAQKKGRKAAPARNFKTGQFEAASPLTDPALCDFAVRTVRAIQDLQPLLAGFAQHCDDAAVRQLAAASGLLLDLIRHSMLEELAADPESLAETKKKRLDAKRLGNMPLAEQQRIQALARDWIALPSAAGVASTKASGQSIQSGVGERL